MNSANRTMPAGTNAQQDSTALVIGGSVAGLWAARVLADHFARVVILERDRLPTQPEPRPGVPQSHQVHVMLLRGLQILDQLFPGLRAELKEAGAVSFDLVGDAQTRLRSHWLTPYDSGKVLLGCSRVLIEERMRQRVLALPNVTVMEGVEVVGLQTDGSGEAISAVTVRARNQRQARDATAEIMPAAFVVDASGRNSHAPQWLAELGFGTPTESVVNSYLGYACRRYRPPADAARDWRMMMVMPNPPHAPRGGLIFPEEDGAWMVMLGGAMRDYPPTDEAGFLEFSRSLGPEFYGALDGAQPLTSIRGYRRTENRLRHYEKLARWPQRFVVMGDAVCAFNPIYGQGMTVSGIEALALDKWLRRADGHVDRVAAQVQRDIARDVAPVWQLATGADYEWPEIEGSARPWHMRMSQWYLDKLLDAASQDIQVHRAFSDVMHLVRPGLSLFAPHVAWRVARHHLREHGYSAGQSELNRDATATGAPQM